MSRTILRPGAARYPNRPALIILAAAFPLFLAAQRFFPDQQPLPSNCEEWAYYQQLHREQENARSLIDHLLERGRRECSANEFFYLQLALQDLADRREPFLNDRLGSPGSPFHQLISRLITVDSLLACEAVLLRSNQQLDQLEDLCAAGFPSPAPPDEGRRAEIDLYRFRPGQVVAEIGAGNENFAASLHYLKKGLTVFVNDIDTLSVLRTAYHFEHSPLFAGTQNQFFAILGTGQETGLGTVKADRIIIRNAFHHFEDPQSMLQSIEAGLNPEGIVFLYERFAGACGENCCPALLSRAALLDLFRQNGFRLNSEHPGQEADRWILGFIKAEG